MTSSKPNNSIDFSAAIPERIRHEIETALANEDEDVKSAGKLGFMARALVQASMPYKDPKTRFFERVNGDFRLTIFSAYGDGVPYGIYPRLLMSFITTEAIKTQSPEIVLGESLGLFLKELDITKGSANTRFKNQMLRLLSSFVSVSRGNPKGGGFELKNVTMVDSANITKEDENSLWQPQTVESAGQWKSRLTLSSKFFAELVDSPVPIDLRAYIGLKASPLAMDVYSWLTYRMSYLRRSTNPLPWELLQLQFGSGYPLTQQGARNFKKSFILALKSVLIIYPQARVEFDDDRGLILHPSPTHIPSQKTLPF